MNYRKVLSVLYLLLITFSIILIANIANHLYVSTIDGHFNGFFKTAIQSSKLNYFKITGRWAQGLTFDFRLHTQRVYSTTFNSALLFLSVYFLSKQLLKKYALISTAIICFSFFYTAHNLYQITHLLNTALSYTFGLSLIFIFFGIYFKYPKPNLITLFFSMLLLLFITGLVEHLFVILLLLLGYLVLEDIVFSLQQKRLKLNKYKIIYLVTTLVGSFIVVFSPGSLRRRLLTNKRLETSEYSGSFDFERFFETIQRELIDQFNVASLLFLLAFIVIFSTLKKQKYFISKISLKPKAIVILLFALVLLITPITVGFIASNGKVGMPKAYNLTVILFLFFLGVLAYAINVFFTIKLSKKVTNLILTLPLIFYIFTYLIPGNNLYTQQNQFFSGNLKSAAEEVFARRVYLAETNTLYQEKVIPKLSQKYHNKVYAAHKYPKMNMYYIRAFNNGIPVYTDKNLPSPLEFTSIFLVNNNKLKPIFTQDDYQVFYNKHLHTLIIKNSNSLFNQTITQFNLDVENTNSKKSKAQVSLKIKLNQKPFFYKENPNCIAIVLPRKTKKVSINQFKNCDLNFEDKTLQKDINYNFEYGNIMR